ncbi:zinc finger BED domain-containing protein RICESLEEPER 2-like protein [Tanacetum coccineum]
MRKAHSSGAEDEDYFAKALLDYEAEFRVPFTLHHCWEVLRHSLKWWEKEVPRFGATKNDAKRSKTSGSSSFNTESGDASINMNFDARDEDEDDIKELPRPIGRDKTKGLKKKWARSSGLSSSMNDKALGKTFNSKKVYGALLRKCGVLAPAKMIMYGLCQRNTSYDNIQRNELQLMNMFEDRHQQRYANVASLIARWMKRKGVGTQKKSMIICGQFETKLVVIIGNIFQG